MTGVNKTPLQTASDIWRSKATWTGIAAIFSALVGAYFKEITWEAAVMAIFAALQSIWIRDTISKTERSS